MRTRLAWTVLGLMICEASADAQALDPTQFQSLGSLSGSFAVDSSAATLTSGGVTYQGVIYNGIAVFDFNSVTLGNGTGTGSLPVAILSRGNETLTAGSTINFGGGYGSNTFTYTPRGMGAFNIVTLIPIQGTNGPGGSNADAGGPSQYNPPPSRGGYGSTIVVGSVGGGGAGGSFQLGAVGQITIGAGANVFVDGGPGGFSPYEDKGSGGGKAGGIYLHASTVDLEGLLSAKGGAGGGGGDLSGNAVGGDGGAGGVIRIETDPGGFVDDGILYATGGQGGNLGTNFPPGAGGANGLVIVNNVVVPSTVPEPSTLAMAAAASLVGAGMAWRRRGRA